MRMSTLREASAIGAAVIGVKALGLGEFEYVRKIARAEKVFKPKEVLIRVFNEKLKLMIDVYKANKRFFKRLNTKGFV